MVQAHLVNGEKVLLLIVLSMQLPLSTSCLVDHELPSFAFPCYRRKASIIEVVRASFTLGRSTCSCCLEIFGAEYPHGSHLGRFAAVEAREALNEDSLDLCNVVETDDKGAIRAQRRV